MLDIFLAHFTENLRTFKGIFMFILRDELYLQVMRMDINGIMHIG